MEQDALSTTFAALADPTRRAILARLTLGEMSVTDLAEPYRMTLPAISKHIKVLERAGLVARSREAQWRRCRIQGEALKEAVDYMQLYRQFWEQSFDRLDDYVQELLQPKAKPMETFTITRIFDAPRPLVFECWTKPEHFGIWFGPEGSRIELLHSDVRPGGYNHVALTMPDGTKLYGKYTFREVTAPERLVFVSEFVDAEGNLARHPMSPDWPLHLLTTVTFKSLENQTELTVTWTPIDATDTEATCFANALDGCRIGWTGTFDRLEAYLPTVA